MCLTCFGEAHRHCVAHILLSPTFKSNNFSQLMRVCTIHTQHGRFHGKKSVLSTGNHSEIANKVREAAKRFNRRSQERNGDRHKKAQ
ncbi:hypothetical protein BSQ98_13055 [Serratia liquefaciens]|nr:hypothetical protein AL485_24860 [Serratia liquefaciens]AYO36341.1 hypothetical protein EBA31_03075 [Serratia sp. P2ACOL2]RYM64234.1 hypothetical protein BSQ98_13055 [Serratia liquefaciens]RYM76849.1 hypothetical protein BSR00_04250 [Serratia liquefaciens]RYM80007.1 hypothetical protein BSR01_12215 [Serratia liquefaciens]